MSRTHGTVYYKDRLYLKFILVLLFLSFPGFSFSQACCPDGNSIITTFAGTGASGYTGDGGPATLATFKVTGGLAADPAGNLYVSDASNNVIRKITPAGLITTVAGTGGFGSTGDGGPATLATFANPARIDLDSAGNLYIAEFSGNRIRKVNPAGIVTTFAGTGGSAYAGNGGPATLASFQNPFGVAADAVGNVYFGDNNGAIRKVDTSGIITTYAGTGTLGFSGDGGPATLAKIGRPDGTSVDPSGNIYFWDNDALRVRKIDTCGIITTIAGNGSSGISGLGGPATLASMTDWDGGIAFCGGNLYFGDWADNYLLMVNSCGIMTAIAGNGSGSETGDGGIASASTVSPDAITVDSMGNLYLSTRLGNTVRKIAPDCSPTPTPACAAVPTSTPCGQLPTNTPSNSPTNTTTNTATRTPTNSPTSTPTITPTSTPSNSQTLTQTRTNTSTPTITPTSTPTFTPTPTDTPCGFPGNTCTPTATPFDAFYVSKNIFIAGQESVSIFVAFPESGDYNLSIYNSAGEFIKNLVPPQQVNGGFVNHYIWDGTNRYSEKCASGVYLIYCRKPTGLKLARVILIRGSS